MKRIVSILVTFALCITLFMNVPIRTFSSQIAENIKINVDGREFDARAINMEFSNNAYISVRDLAASLNGSAKEITISISKGDDGDVVNIKSGSYSKVGGENVPFDTEEMDAQNWLINDSVKKCKVMLNDRECYFYGFIRKNSEGYSDFYMSSGELSMMLDMDMSYENSVLHINTANSNYIDIEKLNEDGFFYMTDSCLVGDATTGEIYYSLEADSAVTIASTTKLMTYYVIMDAVSNGEITLNDTVTFSKKAEQESKTSNGVVVLTEGESAPIKEVIMAMLIKSSNECALALAEHLSGSEEAFVERMNLKAKELGLSDLAHFYNPHGLPFYRDDEIMSAKIQNRLTANDMFILVSNLLAIYPQVTDITSIKRITLPNLGKEFVNTNNLLFNVPEVVGLKTGTTTKAGSCLVTAAKVLDDEGMEHYIVTIEYGAESALIQSYTSLAMVKYGIQEFNERLSGSSSDSKKKLPENAEELVRSVLNEAKKEN